MSFITGEIVGAHFGLYHPDDIIKLSKKKVVSSDTVDTLGNPVPGGLCDRAMGTADFRSTCSTCHLGHSACPGHMGHLELATPVYNPMTIQYLKDLVHAKCFACHHFKSTRVECSVVWRCETPHTRHSQSQIAEVLGQLAMVDAGLVNEALDMHNRLFIHPMWRDMNQSTPIGTDSGGSRAGAQRQGQARDGEGEGEPPADAASVGAAAMIARIQKYTADAIAAAGHSPSIWRTQYSHINSVREEIVSGFLKSMKVPKCPRCDIVADMIKVRAGFKIFAVKRKRAVHGTAVPIGGTGDVFGEDESESDGDATATANRGANTAAAAGAQPVERYMPPNEVERHMKLLWKNEEAVVKRLFSSISFRRGDKTESECVATRRCDPSMFFLRILAVPPIRFRPPNVMGGQLMENEQTVQYQNIMKENEWLARMSRPDAPELDMDAFMRSITRLQYRVGLLIDSHSVRDLVAGAKGTDAPTGIRQMLERKEGLFRMHMMGKRVNFSARSVISPDPNIETSEIGVPVHFAMKLSYPESVTSMNVAKMRAAVENGPKKYPGANYVVEPDGTVIQLENRSHSQRVSIARTLANRGCGPNPSHGHVYGRKVGRHLEDGDVLLVNRQPTLHKPGIMAHKAKILPGDRVIRMHYANCSTYNADFDGDEINLHFPQSELARADGYHIASTEHQYCVPSSGMPIRGLIQDHVVGGVLLSKRGVFLDKHSYMQLVYAACAGIHQGDSIEPLPPTILKPVARWSGKQVVSTVLRHVTHKQDVLLNLESKARVKGTAWQPGGPTHEDNVLFRNSELLLGVMDRSQFGATAFGLVHAVNELYGPKYSELLLTALGRLFTKYLQMTGFTMGIDDCLVSVPAEKARVDLLAGVDSVGIDVSKKFMNDEEGHDDGKDEDKEMDGGRLSVASKLEMHMFGTGIGMDARGARLDGAFRSALNPIASEVVDKCIPVGQVKPFPANNLALMTVSGAKGSAVNHSQISCLLGQQDVEGRRVPRMINGKSLPCFPSFDPSPRSGGFVTQRFLTGLELPEYFFHCMAGREGLIDTAVKTSSSGYLQRCLIKHLESIRVAYDSTVRQEDGSIIQFMYGEDGLEVTKTPWLKPDRLSFHSANYKGFLHRLCVHEAASRLPEAPDLRKLHRRSMKKKADPVVSQYDPATTLGSISERFYRDCETYIKENVSRGLADESESGGGSSSMSPKDKYRNMMNLKFMRSLAQPGESVGLLAAQSVGEPSTQMTLNSVAGDTRFLLRDGDAAVVTEIGAFIDAEVEAAEREGRPGMERRPNDVLWIPLVRPVWVPSPDENGTVEWRKVEAVTRHPVVNADGSSDLVHVKTDGGHEVRATLGDSFLRYDLQTGRLVKARGDDIREGDLLPVTAEFRLPEDQIVREFDLRSLLPADECVWTTEIASVFNTARNGDPDYPNIRLAKRIRREGEGIFYSFDSVWNELKPKLPWNRCDTMLATVDSNPHLVNAGRIYPVNRYVSSVPEKLSLDRETGYAFGLYCADGSCSGTQAIWSNVDDGVDDRLTAWFHKEGINWKRATRKSNVNNGVSTSISAHSILLAKIMPALCGRFSADKHVPDFMHLAPDDCVSGFLDGYFTGDGNKNQGICAGSRSLILLEGVSALLSRFGIHARFKKDLSRPDSQSDPAPFYYIHVGQRDAARFAAAVPTTTKSKKDCLSQVVPKRDHTHDVARHGSVVLQPVSEVKRVTYDLPWVYDLTVEKTRNMQLFNGLSMFDTFHLAGVAEAKVTLGIPRLREILMTASKNLSAPSMTMPLLPGRSREDALRIAAGIDMITMNELVDEVTVVESVLLKPRVGVVREYALKIAFMGIDMIQSILGIKWSTIRFAVVKRFLPPLLRAVMAQVRSGLEYRDALVGQVREAEKQHKQREKEKGKEMEASAGSGVDAGGDDAGMGDDSDDDSDVASDDDDAVAADDGDARSAMRRRMHGGAHYNADDDEVAVAESLETESSRRQNGADSGSDGEVVDAGARAGAGAGDAGDDDNEVSYSGPGAHFIQSLKFYPSGKCNIVLSVGSDLPRILMMELFHDAAKKAIVRQETGIERCHVVSTTVSDGSERAAVQTDGVNLELAHRLLDDVDVREVTCNSIHDVLETYGVEAARASIVNEVSGVFGMYGIKVDLRHLSLISDYCTHGGEYHGFNRHSMHLNPSPFTRMSFETSSKFLTNATVLGESDHVVSASSGIVVGRHSAAGTGACEVRVPIS